MPIFAPVDSPPELLFVGVGVWEELVVGGARVDEVDVVTAVASCKDSDSVLYAAVFNISL